MIIDCIADLHGNYPKLEGGDLLIVAGDLTRSDTEEQICQFHQWIESQNYSKKIVIAGNHDNLVQKDSDIMEPFGKMFDYLCDSGTEFEYIEPIIIGNVNGEPRVGFGGRKILKIWGSPWTLTFPGINPHCTAFTGDEKLLAEKFALIPDDIDILVTHGPPKLIMDEVNRGPYAENVGSISLMNKVKYSNIKIHVFGHIHEGYGYEELTKIKDGHLFKMTNCSHVNERYEPVNKPIRVEL